MDVLTFATPLPQSARSTVLEWRFPKPYHGYVLTGKSRAAWHTSFIIPQLNLLLDAGLCVNHLRPKHIFLTHGHSDHTLLTPAFVTRDDPPDVFCPADMKQVLDDYVLAHTLLNLGGLYGVGDLEKVDGLVLKEGEEHDRVTQNLRGRLHSHLTHGLAPGDVVSLPRVKDITATAFECDHTVPCLGYVFHHTRQKLKTEYTGLPGPELQKLRKDGIEITGAASTPIFAFLGDTTAVPLAAAPQWLKDEIPVVITECSFLYKEHRDQAVKTKHTIWDDLEPVVRKWPRTKFVLMHFSLRYTGSDIRNFFKSLAHPPPNLVIWIDGTNYED